MSCFGIQGLRSECDYVMVVAKLLLLVTFNGYCISLKDVTFASVPSVMIQ